VRRSTVQYGTVRCGTVRYSTVQYRTGQDRTGQDRTVQMRVYGTGKKRVVSWYWYGYRVRERVYQSLPIFKWAAAAAVPPAINAASALRSWYRVCHIFFASGEPTSPPTNVA